MLKTFATLAGASTVLLFASAASAQDMKATHEFLAKAGASDKFEIAEAKLVEARSHNAKLRKFAAKMIHDHTESTMKLKTAGETAMGHKLAPAEMSPEQDKMLADLKAAHGADFDKVYVDQQIGAHEQALHLMKDYSGTHDYPKIAATAGRIVPTVQMHLDTIRDIKRDMK